MQEYSVFEIIGPRMIGPSSSHTAGAAKLGLLARRIAGGAVSHASITLYGSFAKTGRGHGTDKAIIAGLMGLEPDDLRIRDAMRLAHEAGFEYTLTFSDEEPERPNTVRIVITSPNGDVTDFTGASVGGGNILVTRLNGMDVEFTGDYPTLIIRHFDEPGVITRVTDILAQRGINVAFMRVFRHVRKLDACMIIETDTPADSGVCTLIRGCCPQIKEVRSI